MCKSSLRCICLFTKLSKSVAKWVSFNELGRTVCKYFERFQTDQFSKNVDQNIN